MVAIVDSETLILGTNKYGADDVTGDEEKEEAIVEMFVMVGIENAQQY